MNLNLFDYKLSKDLIAQKPASPRDSCRFLVVDEKSEKIYHKKFYEISEFLKKGDVLVVNDSKVMPARLFGRKKSGGKVEILLLRQKSTDSFEVLLKNFKEKEFNKKIFIYKDFFITKAKSLGGGKWTVYFNQNGKKLHKLIHKFGVAPTPPYIKSPPADFSKYQTVYANKEGSAAAPTAGLHFTDRLMNKLKKQGIEFQKITLHVGLGTFEPIRTEKIEKHKMHSEWANVSKKTAETINKAKKEGRRIIAVGTTATRTLEGFSGKNGRLQYGEKEIDLFIYSPYKFKIIDGLITNFHLPKSTLLMLVEALLQYHSRPLPLRESVPTPKLIRVGERGRLNIDSAVQLLKIYREAIRLKYNFTASETRCL